MHWLFKIYRCGRYTQIKGLSTSCNLGVCARSKGKHYKHYPMQTILLFVLQSATDDVKSKKCQIFVNLREMNHI